ncbi:MAG: sulfatase-like hydrolase/transferase [Oscillospiraceae bacterium]|nr:sulfatase-like hydrolase/transferase [Oscillospiraceae bacterium]
MAKPNVLFILSDQHNAKFLSMNAHPNVKTPCFDKLAAQGVYFNNAITQNPICTPSRMCWISGQYCHNHGYYGLSGPNPDGLPTVFGHFRNAGYKTAAYGKIHCPEYWVEDDTDDFSELCYDCSIGGWTDYKKYLEERDLLGKEDHIGLQEFGAAGEQAMDGRKSFLDFDDSMEGYCVRRGTEFIRKCSKEDIPFFLHISLPRPHECYTPSEPFWSMYDENELSLPPNADYDMKAAAKAPNLIATGEYWRKGDWTKFEPKTYTAGRLRKLHGYTGSVSQVDHAVGRLVDVVDNLGLGDETIIVYGSDHGEYACEHGIIEKAPGICSDAVTKIPMIWRWGSRFERRRVDEIVESVDFVSTITSLCGLPELETGDGEDFSPLLYGGSGEIKSCGVTEFPWSKSLRKGAYRYVFYAKNFFPQEYPDGFGELYNIKDDPWEMNNLYFNKEYADVTADMKEELLQFLVRTTRPATVLSRNPGVSPQKKLRYLNYANKDNKINLKKMEEADLIYRSYL